MNHTTSPTLAQALAQAHTLGLARIDAQLLLLHAVSRPDAGRAWLLAHDTDAMDDTVHAQFIALCQRRLAGEPVAYLTGRKEFYGLPLQVDARVLDPRPDTETLVDWALEVIAPLPSPRVVDLGTGSGAIALALQKERPDARVLAVDASLDALTVAQANAQRLSLPVQFRRGHWMEGLEGAFDAMGSAGYVGHRRRRDGQARKLRQNDQAGDKARQHDRSDHRRRQRRQAQPPRPSSGRIQKHRTVFAVRPKLTRLHFTLARRGLSRVNPPHIA